MSKKESKKLLLLMRPRSDETKEQFSARFLTEVKKLQKKGKMPPFSKRN